jgi:hypothetical protein
MKRFFLVLVLILVALAWMFFGLRRVWKMPGAKLVSHSNSRTLTSQELNALQHSPGIGALPGAPARSSATGLPRDVQQTGAKTRIKARAGSQF